MSLARVDPTERLPEELFKAVLALLEIVDLGRAAQVDNSFCGPARANSAPIVPRPPSRPASRALSLSLSPSLPLPPPLLQVCRVWRAVCSDGHVWKTAFQDAYGNVPHPITNHVAAGAAGAADDWRETCVARRALESKLRHAWLHGMRGAFNVTGIMCGSWVRVVRLAAPLGLLCIGLASGAILVKDVRVFLETGAVPPPGAGGPGQEGEDEDEELPSPHGDEVLGMEISGSTLVSSGACPVWHRASRQSTDSTVHVYDLVKRALLHAFAVDGSPGVPHVAILPSQHHVLAGGSSGHLVLWDKRTPDRCTLLQRFVGAINCTAALPAPQRGSGDAAAAAAAAGARRHN